MELSEHQILRRRNHRSNPFHSLYKKVVISMAQISIRFHEQHTFHCPIYST